MHEIAFFYIEKDKKKLANSPNGNEWLVKIYHYFAPNLRERTGITHDHAQKTKNVTKKGAEICFMALTSPNNGARTRRRAS